MAKTLTKKQRGFVNDYAETGNGTQAVLKNYNTEDEKTASVMAVENLAKPSIQEELKKLGFDTNNAKRVVGEILNKEYAEDKDRLKAAEIVLKSQGELKEEKPSNTYNFIFNADVQKSIKELENSIKAKLLGHVEQNN